MGNYKFKFSELIPNAWFNKLKDPMGKSSRKPQKQNTAVSASSIKKQHAVPTSSTTTTRSPRLQSRRSSYYSRPDKTTPFNSPTADTPEKSTGNMIRQRSTATTKSPADPKLMTSSACSCRTKTWSQGKSDFNTQLDFSTTSGDSTATGTGSFSPEFRSDQVLLPDESSLDINSSPCTCISSTKPKSPTFTPPKLDLRPIITKSTPAKRSAVNSPAGVRLRLRSPRISGRKSTSSAARRSGSSCSTLNSRRSRAVVKASLDPKRDFKESMMEMIVVNKIRGSKDLEELLACYLFLNSGDYHDIIINVFKQIWLDLKLPTSNSK